VGWGLSFGLGLDVGSGSGLGLVNGLGVTFLGLRVRRQGWV
jgi:hypothetical protein